MFGSAVTFGRNGLRIANLITWFCVVGVFLHGARYEMAEVVARMIERRYERRHGRRSSVDSAQGQTVVDCHKHGTTLATN